MVLLELKDKNNGINLILEQYTIKLSIDYSLVHANLIMVWRNPTKDKDLEGELTFPLENKATVVNYSVDIEGQMVSASIVEKEVAKEAYETEVREKRAGPAILESVAGNVFKTKIYPIRAGSTRTVSIEFECELSRLHDLSATFSSTFTVDLDRLNQFEFQLDSLQRPTLVQLTDVPPTIDINDFVSNESSGGRWQTRFKKQNSPLYNVFISFPVLETSQFPSCQFSWFDQETVHFVVNDLVPSHLLKRSTNTMNSLVVEGSILVYFDCSFSRGSAAHHFLEIQALINIFQSSLFSNNSNVDIVCFQREVTEKKRFNVKTITHADISKFVESQFQNLAGATDLSKLEFPPTSKQGNNNNDEYSMILLCTDGFSTLSANEPNISCPIPLFTLCDDKQCNQEFLKRIAWRNGGFFFQLTDLQETNMIDLRYHLDKSRSFQFLRARFDDQFVSEIFPHQPTLVINSVFQLFGMIKKIPPSKTIEITLEYTLGTKIIKTTTAKISLNSNQSPINICPLWAKRKM